MRPPIAIALIALLVSVVTIFACRKNETPATAPVPAASMPAHADAAVESRRPEVEACALVSRADVESIFGNLKGSPKSAVGLRSEKECRYQNVNGQWLKASLYGADRWELEKGLVSEQHPVPISALGDEAFSVKQGTDSIVYVRKGGAVLEVSCSCGLEKAGAIAERAITRL